MMTPYQNDLLEHAQAYIAQDWRVFPVHGIKDGKCTCKDGIECKHAGKHPIGEAVPNGHNDATTDINIVKGWIEKYPSMNIGSPAGKASGFYAIDIDNDRSKNKVGDLELEAYELENGKLPDTLIQRSGSGGYHYLFKYPENGIPSKNKGLGESIDIKGDGGYIVLAPSRHISGGSYEWLDCEIINGKFIDYVTEKPVVIAQYNPIFKDAATEPATNLDNKKGEWSNLSKADKAEIRSALLAINADDYDDYYRIGLALSHLTGGNKEGLKLWNEWCATSAKYDEKEQLPRWRSFKDSRITKSTIFWRAKKAGWVAPLRNDFEIIGGSIDDVIERGAWFCKGIRTSEAVFNADGNGKDTLSNADGLPVVACLDIAKIVDDFVTRGMDCKSARIAADNDCGKAHGNTGFFVALQISKKHGCTYYLPQRYNAETGKHDAVDFADTLEFIKGVANSNKIDHCKQLVQTAPINQVNGKVGKQLAFAVAEITPAQMSVNDAIELVNTELEKRGADLKKVGADRIINAHVKKRKEVLKKLHTIAHKFGLNRVKFDFSDDVNIAIAKFITEAFKGIFLDSRGLGAGKTKLLELLRRQLVSEAIAYVCHRVSLTKDAAGRLNLHHYQDDDLCGSRGAAFCVNSIAGKHNVAGRFNILFLDEFRQILEHVAKGTVENRQEVFDALAKAIEQANIVICSDADLNDRCVNFLREHSGDKSIHLVEVENAPANNKKLTVFDGFEALRADLIETVKSGVPVIIANTSREVTEQNELLLLQHGIDYNAILSIHSKKVERLDRQAALLANPNEEAIHYLILNHSPSIGSGVSFETPHFAVNYLFDSGNLPANEKLQMLARNRTSNDYRVAFARQKQYDRITDQDLLHEGEGKKAAHYTQAIRVHGQTAYVANELGKLRIELTAERNGDLNDFANNLVLLAELKGMAIDYKIDAPVISKDESKQLKKEVKQATIEKVFNAPVIDAKTAEKMNADAKKEHAHEIDRLLTTVIAGTPEITLDDVENVIYKKAVSQVTNHELLSAKPFDLKNWDIGNASTQTKTICKTSVHALGNHVINELMKHERIDRKIARPLCDYLNENAAEIAANGLGNYTKVSKNPLRTLGTFVEKFGYEFVECEQLRNGNDRTQTFEMQVIEYVSRYVRNRAELR